MNLPRLGVACLMLLSTASPLRAALPEEALAAAQKASRFYHEQVSSEGGYVWRVSADLALREGEGKTEKSTVWLQPPGTPSMGEAYTALYEATGEDVFLEAALASADVLRRGQLRSGCWSNSVELAGDARKRQAYRIEPPNSKQRNYSTLDDDKTQACLRFLIRLDRALKFKNETVHEMTRFALDSLLAAQRTSGGFPQVWEAPADASEPADLRAGFPETWPREYPGHQQYWYRCTLNDDLAPDVLAVLLLADSTYEDPRYERAIRRLGDFLIAAQLPEPQPAWAQQYDAAMHPCWARKFEPPAVSGSESQGVIGALLSIYRRTADRKYLEPVPRALEYLEKSQLSEGRLARFYELETNRPLYLTREYQLTYEANDLPTHYGFIVSSKLDRLRRDYERLRDTPTEELNPPPRAPKRPSAGQEERIRAVIAALDSRGGWVTQEGMRFHKVAGPVLNMQEAVNNLNELAEYLAAVRGTGR